MPNVSEDEANRLILRGMVLSRIDLERLVAHLSNETDVRLQRLAKRFVNIMGSYVDDVGYDPTKERMLRRMLADIRKISRREYEALSKSLQTALTEAGTLSYVATAGTLNGIYALDLITKQPSQELINALASNVMIQGMPQEDYWNRQAVSLQDKFISQIRIGLLQGDNMQTLRQRIRGKATGKRLGYKTSKGEQRYISEFTGGIMDVQTRQANALIRTAVNTVANDANRALYDNHQDVVRGVRILVTLDARTSPICQARAGLEWFYRDGTLVGRESFPGQPPYHFNCRTILSPIVRSLNSITNSADLDEDTRRQARQALRNPTKQTSASGKRYDIRQGYDAWLKDQDKATQMKVLGPGKYRIWKEQGLSVKELVDQTGRPLTVKQLKKKYES